MATFSRNRQFDLTLKAIALIMPHQIIDIGGVINRRRLLCILTNNEWSTFLGCSSSKCISPGKLRQMRIFVDARKKAAQAKKVVEKVLRVDARASLHLRR